ncbi:ankyrin repeat-containing domain protein [Aspergillus carlsbadensis]|nr:ankyrin repeat-containing domain protein [Aspergillus carlsbadensis]
MSDPHKYTVGWICALSTEHVAARVFLDREHEPAESVSANDGNSYILGEIGKHNVVIAVLPDGEYGTDSAASVAASMLHSFPNVRIGLMVGIGGGVPTRRDIRLGDVVVSSPGGGHGGVFQYDYGKTIQGHRFLNTRFLNQPPNVLRTALAALRSQYEIDGHGIDDAINCVLARKPRLRKKYSRPEPATDRLFYSAATHEIACSTVCSDAPSNLKSRPERSPDEDSPAIHYGLIASANQLMKDATIRDELAVERDVLCFEMEAAGLMNNFPCLVIRGICDYADSHKNKEWQGYAAMTAAAYAKDLLRQVHPNRVGNEEKIVDALSGLLEVSEAHRDITGELLEVEKNFTQERLSRQENKCHQMFRLTNSDKDATYEWYKDRVEDRIDGTCMWFLKHENFQTWLNQESGPLLVSADPGCGKSVLAKYLIDHRLPPSATVCYFFFKDQDQNTVRQALCAVLHQLFSQQPCLLEHAVRRYNQDGQGLTKSTSSLWEVFSDAVSDARAGSVIIVLDALDECAESELPDLVHNLEEQFSEDRFGEARLKYLLTCRPYEQIVSRFHRLLAAFPDIRIPGEEASEMISQEVNIVIKHRVDRLSRRKRFPDETKRYLEKRLQEGTHRTYLWVYLVFAYLERGDFKRTLRGVEASIATLPNTVNEAYEQILNKSKDDPMVRKALSIVLAAGRPLTVLEMNVAVNVGGSLESVHDLDLEDEQDFKARLRSWCGLFISVYHDKIYLLHQTAREFLTGTVPGERTVVRDAGLRWHHSITMRQAHSVLAEVCILYLNLFSGGDGEATDADEGPDYSADEYTLLDYAACTWMLHFQDVDTEDDAMLIQSALNLCETDSNRHRTWFDIFCVHSHWGPIDGLTDLMVASICGLHSLVKMLLDKGGDVGATDSTYNRTPLMWATENGQDAVVKVLLSKKSIDIAAGDHEGLTPLTLAIIMGRPSTAELLIPKYGKSLNATDIRGETPLSLAIIWGRDRIVELLLRASEIDLNLTHSVKGAPLSLAVDEEQDSIVEMLLTDDRVNANAECSTRWDYGHVHGTALLLATSKGDVNIVRLLLARDKVDVNVRGKYSGDRSGDCEGTPLFMAAAMDYRRIVGLLLTKADIDVNATGLTPSYYGTPLFVAAAKGNDGVVKQLLANDSVDVNGKVCITEAEDSVDDDDDDDDAESRGVFQGSPLAIAARYGHRYIIARLLDKENVDVNARCHLRYRTAQNHRCDESNDQEGYNTTPTFRSTPFQGTPLFFAAAGEHTDAVRMLLRKGGIDINAKGCVIDERPQVQNDQEDNLYTYLGTPLAIAAWKGRKEIVSLLLAQPGVDMNAPAYTRHERCKYVRKNRSETPSSTSSPSSGDDSEVELESETHLHEYLQATPLCLAVAEQHGSIVRLLLDTGMVAINAKDRDGQTPLWWATYRQNSDIVESLLWYNIDLEAKDISGCTPLSCASEVGAEEVATLLLTHGANIESRDNSGRTPLAYAAREGHEDLVRLLLEYGADVEAKDDLGHTPCAYATMAGNNYIATLLRGHLADSSSKNSGSENEDDCSSDGS